MKRWKKWAIGVSAFLVVMAAAVVWELSPERHFSGKTYPVLAMPRNQGSSVSASTYGYDLYQPTAGPGRPAAESTPVPSPSPEASRPPQDPKAFNALLLGVDSYEDDIARTDVILLMHVMPTLKKVNVISVPRDTRVELPGIGLTKINHAHALGQSKGGSKAGTEAATQAVSDLFGVPIHYYAKMNFSGFTNIIDTIDGVEIEIPEDMQLDEHTFLKAGTKRNMNGTEALNFVRERHSLQNGDFGRQADQMQLLSVVMHKLLEPGSIADLPKVLGKVRKDVLDTNFSDADLISLAWLFKGAGKDEIRYEQLQGHSAMLEDPLMRMPLWYWIPDNEQVKALAGSMLDK